ncbi:hypothetical protein ABK905_07415 [Acerihabitans sp. KWT182]|uniref:Uncharacterized protein n=1 Tax=Acerihabitans sp. KWT182 TaxID=3157919 RepID=A0AAU7QCY4_9GAMM
MDEILTVYAYPPAGTKPPCEKNSDGIYSTPGGMLCEVSNSASNNIVLNYEYENSITNHTEAFKQQQYTQKLINKAEDATIKLLKNESAKLAAQQQAVKNLVEMQKVNLKNLQAQSLKTREFLVASQNKIKESFHAQQQRFKQNTVNVTQHHSNIQAQHQKCLNRIQSMPNPKVAKRNKELQLEAERKAKAELERITEEHNRQLEEHQRQLQELEIQLKVQNRQIQEGIANLRKISEIDRLDIQALSHEFSEQIILIQNEIDRDSNPEHKSHLWLNDAKNFTSSRRA